MRVSQCRCLKCGTVFTSAQRRISYCTCCFADETYLKPVEDAAAARPAEPRASEQPSA